MISLFQHLLPDGRAWRTTIDKRLRQFFEALTVLPIDVKDAVDSVWSDIFPETTDAISEWEQQFGIAPGDDTEQERRDRLTNRWRELVGGQAPRYIEDTLRANGFDVYVHEWWAYRRTDVVSCGEAVAECGEAAAESANPYSIARDPLEVLAPDNITPVPGKGYPLVNLIRTLTPSITVLCGESFAECGEVAAESGAFTAYSSVQKEYFTPTDPDEWPYVLYIGGINWGDVAQVDDNRRAEFEELCLKICPTQQWLGMIVEYI